MTDYEYIITQCRKYNNRLWDDKILKECINKLKSLSVKELCNLLLVKEVHKKWDWPNYSDDNVEDIEEDGKRQSELKSAIVKAIPTIKLAEIICSTYNDYDLNNGSLVSMDYQTFYHASKLIKKELRRRYHENVDCQVIEDAFNHTCNMDRKWLKWQKQKRKLTEIRYQDPFFKKLKDIEIFADEEFVDHGLHGYDNVISIKGCRDFWDEDGKRISAIDFILNACGVAPQYIGLGDEVVFAVASDNYELESAFEYKPEYMNSRLRNNIDKIFEREYDKNLVLGCMLVEKFIRIVEPKVNVKVRCYDKNYLLGHFVIECPDKLFTAIDTIADIKDLIPKDEKIDAFTDLLDILLNPSWKLPF